MAEGSPNYLAIDIGGTKTLLAVFSASGQIIKQSKYATPASYEEFLSTLDSAAKSLATPFSAVCCAVPGRIDRSEGMVLGYGTLQWPPIPLKYDLQKLFNTEVMLENDAKLAGLSEAIEILNNYRKVLYVTLGTGVGTALIQDGKIDPSLADSEGGQIILNRGGKQVQWEDLVSGRAIKERFGKLASEIDDPAVWQAVSADLAEGLYDLIAVIQPEVVIIGGGVGAHFNKFGQLLNIELQKLGSKLVPIPPVLGAKRAEEAVVYGCYDFVKNR